MRRPTPNARLSTQLPNILAVSRFAHYLKAMMRDKIGSFMSRTDCERWLNQWIQQYVTPDDTATPAVKAQHPLREGASRCLRSPASPGSTGRLPSCGRTFQLDELSVSLRLWRSCRSPRGSMCRSSRKPGGSAGHCGAAPNQAEESQEWLLISF